MDNNVLLDKDESLDKDMNKEELNALLVREVRLTQQAREHNPNLAQEYYEKVQHLVSIMHNVKKFERQLLIDLDVD